MPAKTKTDERAALLALTRQLAALPRMTVGNLQAKYRELKGEPTRTRNKDWLVKQVAYLMQEHAHGGLSERATARLSDLGDRLPDTWRARLVGQAIAPAELPAPVDRDPRLPPVGTVIKRAHGGKEHAVTVLADSFIYDGKPYKSLTEIAKAITGTQWNGFRFFGLNK